MENKAADFIYPLTKMFAGPKFHKEILDGFRDLNKFLPEYNMDECALPSHPPSYIYNELKHFV